MNPALRGKRARWLGSLDQPHTLNYLEDMARALVTLGERDEADGQVWHLPPRSPSRAGSSSRSSSRRPGTPPKIGVASRPMIRMAGLFNPLLRELNETLYQFERPFVLDAEFQCGSGRSSRPRIRRPWSARWTGSGATTAFRGLPAGRVRSLDDLR